MDEPSLLRSTTPLDWRPYADELRKPVWNALTFCHAQFGEQCGPVLRYKGEFNPFCAVETDGIAITAASILGAGAVMFSGELPTLEGQDFIATRLNMVQMVAPDELQAAVPDDLSTPARALSDADIPDMMALAHRCGLGGFFRPRTKALGPYVGIYQNGVLVAMSGERMRLPHFFELSGVCTDPAWTGRGYARYLMCLLAQQNRSAHPMLHTMSENHRAINTYERMGFQLTHQFPMLLVEASTAASH